MWTLERTLRPSDTGLWSEELSRQCFRHGEIKMSSFLPPDVGAILAISAIDRIAAPNPNQATM